MEFKKHLFFFPGGWPSCLITSNWNNAKDKCGTLWVESSSIAAEIVSHIGLHNNINGMKYKHFVVEKVSNECNHMGQQMCTWSSFRKTH
jgi:hypothetical protein